MLTEMRSRLDIFPESATIEAGELAVGGMTATALAGEFGTPLVVYCEETLVARARAYVRSAPGALVVYGVKAFPNVALLALLVREGLGADVSTLGELEYARRAAVPGDRIVVHGNNKSDEELRAAARLEGALVVMDAPEEVGRAAAAGVRRILIRVTPGIEADTHESIRTAHRGSKFGFPPEAVPDGVRAAATAGLHVAGLHVHVGSQLGDSGAPRMAIDVLAALAAECRAALGWTPEVVNLGGGLGIAHVEDEAAPAIEGFVADLTGHLERAWALHRLPPPALILEPGRSLVGEAALTLYRVGVVKDASATRTWVAIDGGMADNPRPQLYGARYTGLLANRADEPGDGFYTVCGKHCESGDVLIDRLELPRPRRGDLLAVPATGAYTLGMGSNYNALGRPAVVLVAAGQARLIRRRETIDDLLATEAG